MARRATISLDGSKSYDPDGYIVSWLWRQINGPAVIFTITTGKKIQTMVNQYGNYSFELTVTDNEGASRKDTIVIPYQKK